MDTSSFIKHLVSEWLGKLAQRQRRLNSSTSCLSVEVVAPEQTPRKTFPSSSDSCQTGSGGFYVNTNVAGATKPGIQARGAFATQTTPMTGYVKQDQRNPAYNRRKSAKRERNRRTTFKQVIFTVGHSVLERVVSTVATDATNKVVTLPSDESLKTQ